MWYDLFGVFKGGADWVLERPLALSALQSWRTAILQEHAIYTARVDAICNRFEREVRNALPQSSKLTDSPGWVISKKGQERLPKSA